MKKFLLLLVLAGCGPNRDFELENKQKNEQQFLNPAVVGVLADGKLVKTVEYKSHHNSVTHYIYFVGEDITVNTSSGKSSAVYVMLNGKALTVTQAQIELTALDAKNKDEELKRLRAPHK